MIIFLKLLTNGFNHLNEIAISTVT
jgi:hypothetical protein